MPNDPNSLFSRFTGSLGGGLLSASGALAALLLVVGLAGGWFAHKAVNGLPDIAMISVYDDWRLACPQSTQKDASCELQQDFVDAKTRSGLASLVIVRLKGDDTLIITVPYNVALEPGVGLVIGNDKPRVYPFETCNGVGCISQVKLDDALRSALAGASQLRVLVAGLDGKVAGVPFSIKGYSQAAAAYENAEGKRRSWWRRLWS